MQPYNAGRSKHRRINRDDIYHTTHDTGRAGRLRRKSAKRARKAARQEAYCLCRRHHEELVNNE